MKTTLTAALLIIALSSAAFAQVDRATLTGVIKDALGSSETTCINVPIDPGFVARVGASKLSV